MNKPPLISYFFHAGPSLSDFNSVINPITPSSTTRTTTANHHQSHPSTYSDSDPTQVISRRSASNGSSGSRNGCHTTSTVTRVVSAALPLPAPVACSPFSKKENQRIELAWKILDGQQKKPFTTNHHQSQSQSQDSSSRTRSSSSSSSAAAAAASASQTRPAADQNNFSSLKTSEPDGGFDESENPSLVTSINSRFDRKGKGRFVVSESISILGDDQDTLSGQSLLHESQLIDSQDLDPQDGVLNLALESHPHIVPVGIDSLFTVDVRRLKLYPAFWHGPQVDIYRGQWFYPSTSQHKFYPCDPELAEALEDAYDQIRPWDLSYEDELRSALKIGTEAEDKLKVHLKKFDHDVIFQTATQGRLYSTGVSSRISKTILTNFFTSISHKTAGYSGGTVVVRGWDQARFWSGLTSDLKANDEKESPTENEDHQVLGGGTGFNTTADMLEEEDLENPNAQVSELVLVIHGIGQKLAQSYDSFDFVHACNQLRVDCHKASMMDPKMKEFLQNRRVQLIPIRWRQSLNFEMEGFNDNHEESGNTIQEKSTKNTFTLKDIEIPDSIPFVREIVTSLVLDVPLYMSPKEHKLMIAAVIEQANKVYQLFCRRNPYYTGRKVSILAHSLGAALTVDVLSRQPSVWTTGVEASQVIGDPQKYLSTLNHFCFDTSKVFLVGSPVPFFFHLHRAQLIAREGICKVTRLDTNHSPEWRKTNRVTANEVGQYGCLAAETVYNVYISTDPVAYCMNACVDSEHSKNMKPIDAHSFTKTFLEHWWQKQTGPDDSHLRRNVSLSSLSSLIVNSWLGSKKGKPNSCQVTRTTDCPTKGTDKPIVRGSTFAARPASMAARWPPIPPKKRERAGTSSGIFQDDPTKKVGQEESIGRMRFLALNPSGSVDFAIPSLGLNQYVDMVTAHAAYWSDIRFARLILVGLFGEDADLNEVGGLETHPNKP